VNLVNVDLIFLLLLVAPVDDPGMLAVADSVMLMLSVSVFCANVLNLFAIYAPNSLVAGSV
jgi:hypothetical protein